MADDQELKIYEEFTDEELQEINNNIVRFNETSLAPLNYQRVCLVLKDHEQKVMGGIIAFAYWDCVFIDVLWVHDSLRHKGYGRKILEHFEKIVKNANFRLIHLDTFDFQAPKFYKKNGYQIYAVLEDCPKGHKRYYMKKLIK